MPDSLLHRVRIPLLVAGLAGLTAASGRWLEPSPGKETTPSGTRALLRIDHGGRYHFGVRGAATLRLVAGGDTVVVRAGGPAPPPIELRPGAYPLELIRSPERSARPDPVAFWSREISLLHPIPDAVLHAPDAAGWRFAAARAATVAGAGLAALAGLGVIACFGGGAHPLLFGTSALAVSLAAAVGLAEVLLRIAGFGPIEYIRADQAQRYHLNEPGAEMEYSGFLPYLKREFVTTVRFNALGYRDDDHEPAKPEGVFRIAVLGDSYVEALEVDLAETFWKRLESLLNEAAGAPRFQVLAFGRGATGPDQHVPTYAEVVRRFDPDLVVLAFFAGNDVMETSPELSGDFWRWIDTVWYDRIVRAKIEWIDRWRWFESSRVNQLVVDRTMGWHLRRLGLDTVNPANDVFLAEYDPRWRRAWRRAGRRLGELAGLVGADGARFLVLNVDPIHALGSAVKRADELGFDPERPNRELYELCEEQDLELVDLAPVMRRLREARITYAWPEDGHWNAVGHRAAAEVLFERLRPDS